jgi:outer membrane protein assembly factor BamB
MKTLLTSIAAASLLAVPASTQTTSPRALASRTANHSATRPSVNFARTDSNLLVYVININFEFGIVDMRSGKFLPIGPGLPEDVGDGLVPGPRTSLLSLAVSGNLVAIDPATGITSVVGATGLHACIAPGSYDPKCPNWIGNFEGSYYVTDFDNNLYSLDPVTGAAKFIGPTGIPPLTFGPFSENPDGSFNVFGESLFGAGGKFYAYFATNAVNFATGDTRKLIPGALYQIDPATGHTTVIGPTSSTLSSILNVNDTIYAFDAGTGEVVTLDLKNGHTKRVSELDPAASVVAGATPPPPAPAPGH